MKTKLRANLLLPTALVLCSVLIASCNQRNTGGGPGASGQRVTTAQLEAEHELDLGEDWTARPIARPGAAPGTRTRPQQRGQQQQPSASNPWSIVLNTYSGDHHAESAQMMLTQLGTVAPELVGRAHVRTTDRGSMVLYGAYPDPNDTRARADLDRIKAIRHQNIPVFAGAFLSRAGAVAEQDHPHSLMSARRINPNVEPLYTLQVAVWSDFDTGQLSREQIRRSAEAYAQELRSRGFEAYFHHGTGSSSVTVGLFNRNDYDVQQGDLNPELTRLRREFPVHLVNGEPVHELIDRRNPQRGTYVQRPELAIVPRR